MKQYVKIKILLALVSILIFAPCSALASNAKKHPCRLLFISKQKSTGTSIESNISTRAQIEILKTHHSEGRVYAFRQLIYKGIIDRSSLKKAADRISKDINSEESNLFGKHYDIVIVGDGPQAAIAATNLKLQNPKFKILSISSSGTLGGAFAATGGFYRLNAPELKERSAHPFPNAPVQLLNVADPGYVLAEDLAQVIVLNLYMASEIKLGVSVESITFNGNRYKIQLSSGEEVYSLGVVAATGLGNRANYGISDPASLEFLYEQENFAPDPVEDFQSAPLVEHYGSTGVRGSMYSTKQGGSFLDAYAGDRVAVVGAGGAGGTLVEALMGFGPGRIYGHSHDGAFGDQVGPGVHEAGGVRSIDWWGQTANSYQELNLRTNNRFANTISTEQQFYKMGRLPGHAKTVRRVNVDGQTKIRLSTRDGKSRDYDHVIFATAYDASPLDWYVRSATKPERALNLLTGELTNGRIVYVGATHERVAAPRSIIVGPSAGQIVPQEEFQHSPTLTWTSIDVLAERTATAAKQLAKNIRLYSGGQK